MGKQFHKVAVLKGGLSSEREVSLRSGAAIAKGLREGGYDVLEIDVVSADFTIPTGIEAVFVALHGTFGEDGVVQQKLADLGLPFSGSDAASCRLAFDKVLTRNCLIENAILVPRGELLSTAADRTLSLPVVVKPPREGSSMGCHLVLKEAQWEEAFADAVRYSGEALVEEYIPGRELTVGVVGNQVLPVVEIKTASEWYDFEAKYMTGETQYEVPAKLDSDKTAQLQQIALKTFQCLQAKDFGRVDFRLSPEGNPYVLELNSIPGFTASSLLPKAADAAGISFSELCCRILEMAHL
jgi:D-alanine-D-alanine ligase